MSLENPTHQFIPTEAAAKVLDLVRQAHEVARPFWRQVEGARRVSSKRATMLRKSPDYARSHPQFLSGLVTADDLAMGVTNVDLSAQIRQAAELLFVHAEATEMAVNEEAEQNMLVFYRNVQAGAKAGMADAKHIADDLGKAFAGQGPRNQSGEPPSTHPDPTPAP